jgi:CTP synthase (UTP-ammonia lyase)
VGTFHIGLVGDYSPDVAAHAAIPRAVDLASQGLAHRPELLWLATSRIAQDDGHPLEGCDALWCVPGSPYASMDGALRAIRFARERGVPFLGTCGGFQHALIEYARDVLGLVEADHAESSPEAALALIAPLACSLVGERGTIRLSPGSRVAAIYGRAEIVEEYHCRYGLDPRYQSLLREGDLRITGYDAAGEARVIELAAHPFFIATLFQPERSAFAGVAHPLIAAFLRATAGVQRPGADRVGAG